MVGEAQKSHGARSELNSVFGLEKVDPWNPIRTPPYSPEGGTSKKETVTTPPRSSDSE
jgi:hypothetical protein